MAGTTATSAFATVGKARASYMGVAADTQRLPDVGGASARCGPREPELTPLRNSSSVLCQAAGAQKRAMEELKER